MGSIRRIKTKRRTRDLDQVKADLISSRHLEQWKETKAAEDLPGMGEHYCIECAKWFEGQHNLVSHRRGKIHKRRVKELKEQAHSQKLADAAVGLSTDNGRKSTEKEVEVMAED